MTPQDLDQWNTRPFERDFSRHLARVRDRYPLPREPARFKKRRKPGEEPQLIRSAAMEAALEARELDVVDYFLRKTEGERPDSDKLAFRAFELQEKGYLARARWVLKRFASRSGAHWSVIPAP